MSKAFTLLSFFILFASFAQAKKYIDGYVLMPDNDTVYCKIKVQNQFRNRYDMYQKVDIINDAGESITYFATQRVIAGFGFMFKDKPQDYVLRKEGRELLFEYREETGKRLNLYSYCDVTNCGVGTPYRVKVYVMQSRTLDEVRLNTGLFSASKNNIRDFLYNDPDLIPLLDAIVSRFSDIRNFVIAANERYSSVTANRW